MMMRMVRMMRMMVRRPNTINEDKVEMVHRF